MINRGPRITSSKYLALPEGFEDNHDMSMFMGYRKRSGCRYYEIQNNLVNYIVMGWVSANEDLRDLKYPEGLLDYQQRDVATMVANPYILNRNKMGKGKTVETVKLLREVDARSVLIVVPKVVLPQWVAQIAKWWPERRNDIVVCPRYATGMEGRVVITNYERITERNVESFFGFAWSAMVCDEVHMIKNSRAKRTQLIKRIPAIRRCGLTGTPIVSRPDDLYSILHWLNEWYVGSSYWTFVDYFCEIEHGPFGQKIKGLTTRPERIAILNKLMSLVSVYNGDSESSDEKPVVEIIKVGMDTAQKKLYKDIVTLTLKELPDKCTIANGAAMTTRLQQVCSCPRVVGGRSWGGKFEWVRYYLDTYPEEKLVVFTRFAQVAIQLQKYLGSICVAYHGQMSGPDRAYARNMFVTSPAIRVLVATIGSLGTGADGLQYVSHTGIFLDRTWAPEPMNQCQGRLDRYGQEHTPKFFYLECSRSYDKHVGKVNMAKSEDIRRALYDESDW